MEKETEQTINYDEFKKVTTEFINDLKHVLPELLEDLENINLNTDNNIKYLYFYCKQIYPSRFFDIIYQNEKIFSEEIFFLPNIDFAAVWKLDLSDQTRETIWKYLQLILFTIVGSIKDKSSFGDAENLFEAIDEEEFKAKIEETIKNMEGYFDEMSSQTEGEDEGDEGDEGEKSLPNPEDIHDHLNSMMDGKIGKLAKEIAEEAASDLNIEEMGSTDELFKKLFQNPTKLMDLVKNVGSKLENKLKSGDLKESELLSEAAELVKNMKGMPGMGDLGSMFGKMAGGGGGKMNMGNFEAQMKQQMGQAKTRDRMRDKLAKRAAERAEAEHKINIETQDPILSAEDKVKKKRRGKKKKKKKKGK